jgi:hypothetical protein
VFENTIRTIAEKALQELPPLTEAQRELVENPTDDRAEALLELRGAIDVLEIGDEVEKFMPAIERLLKDQACWCEAHARRERGEIELVDEEAQKAQQVYENAGEFLGTLRDAL